MTFFDPAVWTSLIALIVADFSVVFPTTFGTLPVVAIPAVRFTRQTLQVARDIVQIFLNLAIIKNARMVTAVIAPSRECRIHQFANILHISTKQIKRCPTAFTIPSALFQMQNGGKSTNFTKIINNITARVTRPHFLQEFIEIELALLCHDSSRLVIPLLTLILIISIVNDFLDARIP